MPQGIVVLNDVEEEGGGPAKGEGGRYDMS